MGEDIELNQVILIAGDQGKNFEEFEEVLFLNGFETINADFASAARDIIEEISPGLIILDTRLPDKDAFDFCREIKSLSGKENIPVIFIIDEYDHGIINRCYDAGADDFLLKPLNKRELTAKVKIHNELKINRKKIPAIDSRLRELMKQKDDFLGIAAHDMKSPVNTILGFTNIALREIENLPDMTNGIRENISGSLETIRETSNFMLKVVTEMLNTETLDSGKIKLSKSLCNAGKILDNVLSVNNISAKAKKIRIFVNDYSGFTATIDEDRFREIAENLVSNAVKYSPFEKNIRVSLTRIDRDGLALLRLTVKDEGPGLTDDDKSKVFHRFRKLSAKPTGGESSSGLGLPIVKKLVELHGGRVWVESAHGEGAEFIVELQIPDTPDEKYRYRSDLKFYPYEEMAEKKGLASESTRFFGSWGESRDSCTINNGDVISVLQNDFMHYWEDVSKTNVVNDIRKFALDVREFGRQNNLIVLENFGGELNNQAIVFDIERLPQTLAYYPEIVKMLTEKAGE